MGTEPSRGAAAPRPPTGILPFGIRSLRRPNAGSLQVPRWGPDPSSLPARQAPPIRSARSVRDAGPPVRRSRQAAVAADEPQERRRSAATRTGGPAKGASGQTHPPRRRSGAPPTPGRPRSHVAFDVTSYFPRRLLIGRHANVQARAQGDVFERSQAFRFASQLPRSGTASFRGRQSASAACHGGARTGFRSGPQGDRTPQGRPPRSARRRVVLHRRSLTRWCRPMRLTATSTIWSLTGNVGATTARTASGSP
jgi:hypothetical protein